MATATSVRKITRSTGLRAVIFLLILFVMIAAAVRFALPSHSAPRLTLRPSGLERPDAPRRDSAVEMRAREAYGRLPLRFELNRGQTDRRVKFLARSDRANLFLTDGAAVLRLRGGEDAPNDVLRFKPVNANLSPIVTGLDELPGRSNYFIGADARQWRTEIPGYGKVKYTGVYPGIDLVYYGNGRQIEYDFVVAPNADPRRIRLAVEGALGLSVNAEGELVMRTARGEVRQRPPVVYQEVDGVRRVVASGYRVFGKRRGQSQIGFDIGNYDRQRTLWIDPVLVFSTYLGGTSTDQAFAIAVDRDGNTYLTGFSSSTDFPDTGPLQAVRGAGSDVFVAKINSAGTAMLFSAYLGGNNSDNGNAIALDPSGAIYIAGTTFSTDFPVTTNAVQRTAAGLGDSFVAKIAASGSSLAYSTIVGGNGTDSILGLAADAAGNAYFTGRTDSTEFASAGLRNVRKGNLAFKSTNRADDWNAVSTGLSASLVNGLAIFPGNSNRLYAATNYGVFKTADGGATWQATNTQNYCYSIAVDPTAPDTIYVGTSSAVMKSLDGGQNYSFNTLPNFPVIYHVLIDPTSPATVYAGTSRGAYKSTNGGGTWVAINTGMSPFPGSGSLPRVNRLVFDPTNPRTLYAATTYNIFKSIDAGANWTAIGNGIGDNFTEVTSIAVDSLSPSTLYAGTGSFYGALFKSTDSGATWMQSSKGISYEFRGNTFLLSVNAIAIDSAAPRILYATTTSGGLFKSIDGGMSWALSRNGLTNLMITALTIELGGTLYAGTSVGFDAFIGKLKTDGSGFDYFRYFGGDESDEGRAVAVDALGNAYVIGTTLSTNFPTANPLQSANRGFSDFALTTDIFVTKFNPAGDAAVYSTYLGGNSTDQGRAIFVDDAGAAYVTGNAASTDFPTANAFRAEKSAFDYDVIVAKLNAAGTALEFSTYLGGNTEDLAAGIAADKSGNVYVTGVTSSFDFPVVNTAFSPNSLAFQSHDVFLSKLSGNGSVLSYSTFIGGARDELVGGIVLDAARNIYFAGATISNDFPTLNALRPFPSSSSGIDAFLVKMAPQADLAVTSTALPSPVLANNRLTYTVKVANQGPDEAADVMLMDVTPAGATNVSVNSSAGSCSGTATVKCNLGELAPGAAATVTVTAMAPASGTLRNTATVSSSTPDSVVSNNSASSEARVSTLPSIAGRVTFASGASLPGATVNLSGGQTSTKQSDGSGAFQFSELAAGERYTVGVRRPGFVIRPQGVSFNDLRTDQIVDFAAVACTFGLTPASQSFGATGGTGTIRVTASDVLCAWTARSNAPWIMITSDSSGTGNGTVSFTVAPATAPRSGTISVGDRTFVVQQEFDACASPRFRTTGNFPLPRPASDLALGDFNGDGQLDAFLLSTSPNAFWLALGDGKGNFGAASRLDVGTLSASATLSMAVGDFNLDGRDDLVVIGSDSAGTVIILPGVASGGQARPQTFNTGFSPGAVAVGNFNGDRFPDLILANSSGNAVAVLPGVGNGSFGAALTTNSVSSQRSFVVGDFNNDKKDDVVILSSSSFVLLLGDGTGKFGAPKIVSTSSSYQAAAGDFDRDGKLDLALTLSASFNSNTSQMAVYRGDGTGGFASPQNFPIGYNDDKIVAGDFNDDGFTDVVTAGGALGDVSLLLNNGTGGFRAPVSFVAGTAYGGLKTGDFNSDGRLDLATLTLNGGDTSVINTKLAQITVLLGEGADFLAPRDTVLTQTAYEVALGDFNSDGRMDAAVWQDDGIAILLGNPAGGFRAPTLVSIPSQIALEVRDFNGDGRLDLITKGDGTLTVLLGDGRGAFQVSATLTTGSSRSAVIADFNRDGRLDVVTLNAARTPTLFASNSVGGFAAPISFGAGMNLDTFAAGDFNGDGAPDIVAFTSISCGTGTTSLILFPGDGLGGFGPGIRSYANTPPQFMLTGDLNGDGRTDLITANGCTFSGTISVAFGSASGKFVSGGDYSFNNGIGAITLGDINSDGRPDLVFLVGDTFSTFSGTNVQVMLGGGQGVFGAPINITTIGKGVSLAVSDINGDGRADIVAGETSLSSSTGGLVTILNACLTTRALSHLSAASFSGTPFAVESIVAVFGSGLATAQQSAAAQPLPTQLAGTMVKITDSTGVERLAPLYFVSPTQVNYQIPAGAVPGDATVTITSGDGAISMGTIRIATVAPGLFTANASGRDAAAALALRVKADGTQSYEPVVQFDAAQNKFVTLPIDLGPEAGAATDQVFLVASGTGFRFRSSLLAVSLRIGGVDAPVTFAGAQGTYAGLDQLNARIPRSLAGRGEVEVVLTVDGQSSNPVRLNIR